MLRFYEAILMSLLVFLQMLRFYECYKGCASTNATKIALLRSYFDVLLFFYKDCASTNATKIALLRSYFDVITCFSTTPRRGATFVENTNDHHHTKDFVEA